MSSSLHNTALVIVPGSFSPPHFYDAVRDAVQKHGIDTFVVKTPSVGRRDPEPPATLADDAAAVQAVTRKLAAKGRDVVLMAHSYGGLPATQSLEGTAKHDGMSGGVIKIVYVSALVAQVGVSCIQFMGQLPEFLTVNDDYISHDPIANAKLTFSDLSEEQALFWAKQMPDQSTPSFSDGLSYAGYKDVNVDYVILEEDMIIPVQYQEAMVDFLEKQESKTVGVYRLKSGHCVNASHPEELAEILRQIVNSS